MQYLTVGEVARRTQLTVRALHHYDALGLVIPSGRSAAGYRLYAPADLERLHAVLSLKQLGLSLEAIQEVLQGDGVPATELLAQQMAEVQRAIEQAQALKDKLLLVHEQLQQCTDAASSTEVLLDSMQLLSSYQQYLPIRQVRLQIERWRKARGQWEPLAQALRQHLKEGTSVQSPDVQRLAQQWMNGVMAVFEGQFSTIQQWAHMHRHAPRTAVHMGIEAELLTYLEQAIGARMAALLRHLTEDDLSRLDGTLAPEWAALAQDAEHLMHLNTPADAKAAKALARRYAQLLSRTVRHDPLLAQKMRQAYATEPILSHGHFLSAAVRDFLEQALGPVSSA